MRNKILRSSVAALVFLTAAPSAWAKNTGASFLNIGVGARALGLGSAFTAGADDATATYWNPAGLSQLSRRELSASHTEWVSDLRHDFLGFAIPTKRGAVALSAIYLSQGGIDRRDAAGGKTGSFDATDAAGVLSFSRTLSPRTRAGVSAKYIQQKIDDAQATGLAFDFGTQFDLSPKVSLGAAVRNLGSDMTFLSEKYSLPTSLTGGASFNLFHGFVMAAELRHEPNVSRTSFNLGTEYQALGVMSLRAGYQALMRRAVTPSGAFKNSGSSLGNLSGFGLGVGLKLSRYTVDYALLPGSELDTTHHLSLSTRF